MGTMVCTCANVPTSHNWSALVNPPKSDSAVLLPEGLLAVLSKPLLEASELLEREEEESEAASAEGTEEDVAPCDCEDPDSESEFAESEAADSADDMPFESSDGCHMKAPTYACALQAHRTPLLWWPMHVRRACRWKPSSRTEANSICTAWWGGQMYNACMQCRACKCSKQTAALYE